HTPQTYVPLSHPLPGDSPPGAATPPTHATPTGDASPDGDATPLGYASPPGSPAPGNLPPDHLPQPTLPLSQPSPSQGPGDLEGPRGRRRARTGAPDRRLSHRGRGSVGRRPGHVESGRDPRTE